MAPVSASACLAELVERIAFECLAEVRSEIWYTGETVLPSHADGAACRKSARKLETAAERRGIRWGPFFSTVVCPTRFNQSLGRWGSKAAVLGESLALLLQANLRSAGENEELLVVVDKHGGRNAYAAILQHALPQAVVLAREEGSERSVYEILGLPHPMRVMFQPPRMASTFALPWRR